MARFNPITVDCRSLMRLAAGSCLAFGLTACKQTEPAPTATAPTDSPQAAAKSAPAPSATPSVSESAGPAGTVRVVSANADVLQRPTTAAFRGQTLWVSIGQLGALFTEGGQPKLPFAALSMTLPAGELGATIALSGPDYYPEGITAAADGTLYIGSIMQGVISKVPAGSSKAEPFVKKGGAKRGVIGLTVDAGRQLLWFCDSNPKLEDAKKAGELVGVKLADASEVVRHALPPLDGKAPFCNDVIVSPSGDLWITDSAGGRVFRVAAEAATQPGPAEAWLTGGEVGPPPSGGSGANGLEWVGGALIVANVGRGTLVKLDPASTDPGRGASVIPLVDAQTRAPVTLCSPDGLELVPGSSNKLIVVENGGCSTKAPRISEITLPARS
jgi:sugar lactone lactonase YvrE